MNFSEKQNMTEIRTDSRLDNYDRLFQKLEKNDNLSQFEKHIANQLCNSLPIISSKAHSFISPINNNNNDSQDTNLPELNSRSSISVKPSNYIDATICSNNNNNNNNNQNGSDDNEYSEFNSEIHEGFDSSTPDLLEGFKKFKKFLPIKQYNLPKIKIRDSSFQNQRNLNQKKNSLDSKSIENELKDLNNKSQRKSQSPINLPNRLPRIRLNEKGSMLNESFLRNEGKNDSNMGSGVVTINKEILKRILEDDIQTKPISNISEPEIEAILGNDSTALIFQEYLDKINKLTSQNVSKDSKKPNFQKKDSQKDFTPRRTKTKRKDNDSSILLLRNESTEKRETSKGEHEHLLPQVPHFGKSNSKVHSTTSVDRDKQEKNNRKLRNAESFQLKQKQQSIARNSFIPSWLSECGDFSQHYNEITRFGNNMLIKMIFMKEPLTRVDEEKRVVATWLRKVDIFRSLPQKILEDLGGRVTLQEFKQDETICRIGDPGKYLYIVFDGLIKAYVNKTVVAIYKKFESVGRSSIENNIPRVATLIADIPTVALLLDKIDYQGILIPFLALEKQDDTNFLKQQSFFKDLHQKKIKALSQHIHGKLLYKDDVVYKKGSPAECFYILKYGLLNKEHIIEISNENVWPIANDRWEKKILTKTVIYRDPIEPGNYFGELEIIKGIPRQNNVVASEESYIIMINKGKFFEIFDHVDIRLLSNSAIKNNQYAMLNKVLEEEENQKRIMLGMIDAMKKIENLKNMSDIQLPLPVSKSKQSPFVKIFEKKLKNLIRQNIVKVEKRDEFIVREQVNQIELSRLY